MGTSWEATENEVIDQLRRCPPEGWLLVTSRKNPHLQDIMDLIDKQAQPMMMVCLLQHEWEAIQASQPVMPMQVKQLIKLLLQLKK